MSDTVHIAGWPAADTEAFIAAHANHPRTRRIHVDSTHHLTRVTVDRDPAPTNNCHLGELAHPDDTANQGEWGPLG